MEFLIDASLTDHESFELAMPGTTAAVLEERIKNHVFYFRLAIVALAAWCGWISVMIFGMNREIGHLGIAQANATSNIVEALLNQSASTPEQAAANFSAAAVILKNSKLRKQKPTPEALKSVSLAIARAQTKYQNLPELWTTTARFIDYKSRAVLPQSAEEHIARAHSLACKDISTGPPIVFTGCTLDLEAVSISSDQPIVFIDSVVRYSGGVIALKSPAIWFENCVFEFDVLRVPPPQGMRLMET